MLRGGWYRGKLTRFSSSKTMNKIIHEMYLRELILFDKLSTDTLNIDSQKCENIKGKSLRLLERYIFTIYLTTKHWTKQLEGKRSEIRSTTGYDLDEKLGGLHKSDLMAVVIALTNLISA